MTLFKTSTSRQGKGKKRERGLGCVVSFWIQGWGERKRRKRRGPYRHLPRLLRKKKGKGRAQKGGKRGKKKRQRLQEFNKSFFMFHGRERGEGEERVRFDCFLGRGDFKRKKVENPQKGKGKGKERSGDPACLFWSRGKEGKGGGKE